MSTTKKTKTTPRKPSATCAKPSATCAEPSDIFGAIPRVQKLYDTYPRFRIRVDDRVVGITYFIEAGNQSGVISALNKLTDLETKIIEIEFGDFPIS